MPFQSVANTALFSCLFAVGGDQRAQFGIYVNNDVDPWDATQLTQKADALRDAIIASYVPVMSQDHDFLGVVGRDLEVQYGRVEAVMEAAPVAGTLLSPSLPGNVSVAATFRAAVGPPRTGRIYLMPPAESQVTGDLLTAGAQGDLLAAVQAIAAAATSGTSNSHVIVSRYFGKSLQAQANGETVYKPTPRGTPAIADVATVSVGSRVDSMRSRLRTETT